MNPPQWKTPLFRFGQRVHERIQKTKGKQSLGEGEIRGARFFPLEEKWTYAVKWNCDTEEQFEMDPAWLDEKDLGAVKPLISAEAPELITVDRQTMRQLLSQVIECSNTLDTSGQYFSALINAAENSSDPGEQDLFLYLLHEKVELSTPVESLNQIHLILRTIVFGSDF